MILGIVILALAFFSFLYFILDGIVAPSEQLILQMKLHETAEEIESLAEDPKVLEPRVAQLMRSAVHGLINDMPRYSICTMAFLIRHRKQDPKFKQECRDRVQLIESADSEQVVKINKKLIRLADKVLITNSISWAVWIVPIALCATMFGRLQRAVKTLITTPTSSVDQLRNNCA